MSLDKSIKQGREWRKHNEKQPGCVNHGSCSWCTRNRLYQTIKAKEKAKYDESNP